MEYFASSIPGFGGISFKSIHNSSNKQLLLRYPSRKHSPNRRNAAPGPVEIRTCSPGSFWNEWSHPLKDPEPDGFYAAHLERKALPYIGGPSPPHTNLPVTPRVPLELCRSLGLPCVLEIASCSAGIDLQSSLCAASTQRRTTTKLHIFCKFRNRCAGQHNCSTWNNLEPSALLIGAR